MYAERFGRAQIEELWEAGELPVEIVDRGRQIVSPNGDLDENKVQEYMHWCREAWGVISQKNMDIANFSGGEKVGEDQKVNSRISWQTGGFQLTLGQLKDNGETRQYTQITFCSQNVSLGNMLNEVYIGVTTNDSQSDRRLGSSGIRLDYSNSTIEAKNLNHLL